MLRLVKYFKNDLQTKKQKAADASCPRAQQNIIWHQKISPPKSSKKQKKIFKIYNEQ